ncbi:hypothetical protein J437_LFUL014723 [Ladona fulva]|uniref:Zasp-like motif domain-containing protein n=1 Tax=Ladona fulva TaxID=123851 RepID=A0A8K0KD44_LADFU|nr:hypothetical protein J437_LFUL014723 [Ladona fulva]
MPLPPQPQPIRGIRHRPPRVPPLIGSLSFHSFTKFTVVLIYSLPGSFGQGERKKLLYRGPQPFPGRHGYQNPMKPVASPQKAMTLPPGIVHRQFNSPLPLYSTEAVAETLNKQAHVLSNGAVGARGYKLKANVRRATKISVRRRRRGSTHRFSGVDPDDIAQDRIRPSSL